MTQMLQALSTCFNDVTVTQVAAAIGVLAATVGIALYVYWHLRRMVRRNPYAYKEFRSEVEPWMVEARKTYANGQRGPVKQ
jgi:hypothetical protein